MHFEATSIEPAKPASTSFSPNNNLLTEPSEAAGRYQVIRRNGKLTPFDASKIQVAMTKAFLAVEGGKAANSSRIHETVAQLTDEVGSALFRRLPDGGSVHIEDIQDQVELALMRSGHQKIARAYVLYREEHARLRDAESKQNTAAKVQGDLMVTQADGSRSPLDSAWLSAQVIAACRGLDDVSG